MKVVLLGDIKGIGKCGDVKEVSDGYYRNFLMPKKLAAPQNDPQATKILAQRQAKLNAVSAEVEQTKALAATLSGKVVTLSAKAQGQKLFGAIRETEVAAALGIEKKRIAMEPIKTVGEHKVSLKLDHGQSAIVTVTVVAS